jgi:cellobiose phosphorylase
MSLLWPPFREGEPDPGYIRAYPPGVRENGGQYTHGVLWTVLARTLLGEGDRAYELFSMLNPIRHATTRAAADAYAVEPYVVAGDVSASADAPGRGGWTWYTGAAGWMYRIGLEKILGISRESGALVISPCVPRRFERYEVRYENGSSVYRIVVENPERVCSGIAHLVVDGVPASLDRGARVSLVDDGRQHDVRVILGEPRATRGADGEGHGRSEDAVDQAGDASGTGFRDRGALDA